MSRGRYEVLALLPEASDFTLGLAVEHFRSRLYFSRAELATAEGILKTAGFRVFHGEWSIEAWLQSDPFVLIESREMAEYEPADLPAPADVIAACSRRLSVISDQDVACDFSDYFIDFTEQLRERFGAFIKDYVNGGWWT